MSTTCSTAIGDSSVNDYIMCSEAERVLIEQVERKMEEMMSKYDSSHDKYHVRRVRRTALALAQSYYCTNTSSPNSDGDDTAPPSSSSSRKPDLLVVELAALMHDMLDKKYVPAELAATITALETFFFPLLKPSSPGSELDLVGDGRAALIARIVDNVSWSTEKKRRANGEWGTWHDECIELHCVQDADRLDAIGAIGIMRCVAYSAATGSALYVPPELAGEDPAAAKSAIQHFHDKLIHIRERMKTEPGKRMAVQRHEFMLRFLEAVDDEYTNKLF